MKKNRILYVAMLVLAIATLLVGCGKKTIEEMLTDQDLKDIAQEMIAGNTDVYSDAKVEVTGNSINYIFYFVDGIDVETTKKNLANSSQLAAIKDDAVKYFQTTVGITPEVDYEFYDYKGNLMFSSKTGMAPSAEPEVDTEATKETPEEVTEEVATEEVAAEGEYTALVPSGETITFSTLEEYYYEPSVEAAINDSLEQMIKQYETVYCDAEFFVEGNNVYYRYYYVEGSDEAAIKKGFESQDIDSLLENGKAGILSDTGIEPEVLAFEYYNSNRELIISFEK